MEVLAIKTGRNNRPTLTQQVCVEHNGYTQEAKWISFLTCVCFHVLIKILFHVEVFATPLAHELLVSDVNAHVGP